MANIPAIIKHMTLAILRKSHRNVTSKVAFKQAFDAAVSRCIQYGFVTGGGDEFQLTRKGQASRHEKEGMRGFVKNRMFDVMYARVMSDRQDEKTGITVNSDSREEQAQKSDIPTHVLGRGPR